MTKYKVQSLRSLREVMKADKIDCLVVPRNDEYLGERAIVLLAVAARWAELELRAK